MQLELKQVHINGGTQPRVAIDEQTVAEYAEALREGVKFPPVVAFYDGVLYWLADGFHRYHAHRRAGLEKIEVDVKDGTLRDAILYSVGANAEHGLRRTNEDKRKAVVTMLTHELALSDAEGHPWSNMEIARRCHVSEWLVRDVRKGHTSRESKYEPDTSRNTKYGPGARTFTHPKTGKPATMNTTKIGRNRKQQPSEPAPVAKDAFKPNQFHGPNGPVPMQSIQLPLKNPRQAARGLWSVFGDDYMYELTDELNRMVQKRKEA